MLPIIGPQMMHIVDCWAADNRAVKDRAMNNGHCERWCSKLCALQTVEPRTIGPRLKSVASDGLADNAVVNDGVADNDTADDVNTNNISMGDRVPDNRATENGHCQQWR